MKWIFIILAIFIVKVVFAHGPSLEANPGHLLIEVETSDNFEQDYEVLSHASFDIAYASKQNREIHVITSQEGFHYLSSLFPGRQLTVAKNFLLLAPDEEYQSPEDVEAWITDMTAAHPDLFHAKPIGKSLEGRTIWSIRISDDKTPNAKEPSVLFNALHHAREVMTVEVIMDIADWLLENYDTNPAAKAWLTKLQIYLIPMVNPDGSNKVWSGSSLWRKNVRGGHGVDINRNYPYKWNGCGGSSGSTFAQDYRGPSAASEPETQVMVSFVKSIRPSFNISFHSYGEMVIFPFGCKGQRTPVDLGVERIGKEMAKLINYNPGTSWDILYDVDGGDIDWMFGEAGVIPFVIEVSPKDDGFQPGFETRDPLVKKMRTAWQFLLQQFSNRGIQITTTSNTDVLKIEKVVEGKLSLVYTGPSMTAPKFFPLEMGEYQVTFQSKNANGEVQSVVERVKLDDNLPKVIHFKGI